MWQMVVPGKWYEGNGMSAYEVWLTQRRGIRKGYKGTREGLGSTRECHYTREMD